MKFKHGEAFALMQYWEDGGRAIEWVWNSRDGVTPFMIGPDVVRPLSRTDKMMQHELWQEDVCAPFFVPPVGMRIFVDMTKERLLEIKRGMVERFWDDGELAMSRDPRFAALGKDGAAKMLADADFKEGQPDIVKVTPEIRATFEGRARKHDLKALCAGVVG